MNKIIYNVSKIVFLLAITITMLLADSRFSMASNPKPSNNNNKIGEATVDVFCYVAKYTGGPIAQGGSNNFYNGIFSDGNLWKDELDYSYYMRCGNINYSDSR